MKSKHGFNFLLLVGHLALATNRQPDASDHHADDSIRKDDASRKRRSHAQ